MSIKRSGSCVCEHAPVLLRKQKWKKYAKGPNERTPTLYCAILTAVERTLTAFLPGQRVVQARKRGGRERIFSNQ